MSVRTLLFGLLAAVIVGLISVQWWLTRQQHQQLALALSTTAFTVSRDTISVLLFEQNDDDALLHDQSFEMRLDNDPQQGSILLRSPQFEHRITIPKASMQRTLESSQRRQLMLALLVSCAGIIVALVIAYRFARPLQQLQSASQRVASGQMGEQLQTPEFAPRELAATIAAFNRMSQSLLLLEQDNRALRAREQVDELSDLARGLAHTMRNPLNTLGLSLDEMARRDIDDDAREQLAGLARRQIHSIDNRLRALLDVSANAEQNQTIVIAELIRDVCAEFGQQRFQITGDDNAALQGQSREISMVLHTLISNAVEASSPDSAIAIQFARQDNGVSININDQGVGISTEVNARLFQPHVSDKPHGAGLGLYLAKRVVSGRYRGDIHLSANTPQGTCAQLYLQDRRA